MRAKFVRGQDPKKTLDIGRGKIPEPGERIRVLNPDEGNYWNAEVEDVSFHSQEGQEEEVMVEAYFPSMDEIYVIEYNEDFGDWVIVYLPDDFSAE